MSRRAALLVPVVAVAVAAGVALAATGGSSERVVSYCRADPRPPLPPDIRRPERSIIAIGQAVLRSDARNPSSAFARVLAGSWYAVDQSGVISSGQRGWHGRQDRIFGATFDVRVLRPHGFDTTVPVWGREWPRGSPNYRYSRHFGYVPYRARMASRKGLSSLSVDVDVRTRRVIDISSGLDAPDIWEPIAGHCPLRPFPPED
jgi:hypothetical protein